MEDIKELSLLKETEREAREIENELKQHPELEEIQVTDEMDAALFARIKAYEETKEKERMEDSVECAGELTPEIPRNPYSSETKTIPYRKSGKKKYIIIGIAAVLVIVMSTGLVGVGNKSYWKEVLQKNYGEDELQVIKVEDMDDVKIVDGEKENVFAKVSEDLGVSIVRFGYIPQNLYFSRIELTENMRSARMFFYYEGEVLRYTVYLNSNDSEKSENVEDIKIGKYSIIDSEKNIEIEVIEYQVPKYREYRRIAEFEYKGIYYQLKGIMTKEEFDKILSNLRFF